ncbi:MAG: hypothetical protein EBY18_12045 [Alphaproteobacteria bacterium]|nr:hypothetical protein [Alphaproteobacteria bacterium]
MSVRSIRRLSALSAALSAAAAVAACSGPNASEAYTGPGWYLEKPYMTVATGPKVFGGPYSYTRCEEERTKLGPEVATGMLCANHPGKPTKPGNL